MDQRFLDACRARPTDCTPVWFMRQAGRFQPEYRELRKQHDILEICRTPELAAEVTMLPVDQFGVDAAILFSDIMIPVAAMGASLRIEPGVGPVIDEPVRTLADVAKLNPVRAADDLEFLDKAIRMLVSELKVPLIGFAGGPFTLASYLVEGGPSRAFLRTRALMNTDPQAWHSLMTRLTDTVVGVLRAQLEAGASAVQLFDSWVGMLSPADYEANVLPYSFRIFTALQDLGAVRIHFGVGTGELLVAMREAGADVIGVDWRTPIDVARARIGAGVAIQGNLDPAVLLAPWPVIEEKTRAVLAQAAAGENGRTGHIFNLGHGVLPQTDPDTLRRLTEFVHEQTKEPAA